jgi:hypothetical protein
MKAGTKRIIQNVLFLGALGAYYYYIIKPSFLTPVAIFLGIILGLVGFWAVGNKGNRNFAMVRPLSGSWRMLVYFLMWSPLLLRVFIDVIIGNSIGYIMNLTPASVFFWGLPLLMAFEYEVKN